MGDFGWIFDPIPPSGAIAGGDTTSYVFKPSLDIFVREVIQNANDQRAGASPVEVTFEFDVVDGDRKGRVLEALGWSELLPHLDAVAGSSNLLAGRIRDLLDRADEPLVMLFIRDRHTRGLVGDEDGQSGNFGPLCRHKLVTTDDKALKGGSHGLGKAVLWSFSGISTVGFSSMPKDDPLGLRFIARAELPYHKVGDAAWAGPGWLGTEESTPNGRRSVSVHGADAETIVASTGFERTDDEIGTTILVPFFFEPEEEQQRDPEVIARSVLGSISRWFWPSLDQTRLIGRVVVRRGGEVSFEETAKADGAEGPFLAAWAEPETGSKALEPDSLAERAIPFSPPALKGKGAEGPFSGSLQLRIKRAGEGQGDHDLIDSIALVRGAHMVVKYYKPRNLPLGSRGFFGVLKVGRALGSTDADSAIEDFFRSAEPPQHNEWLHNTNNLRSRYQQGSKARLDELWAAVERATGEMCRVDAPLQDEGPQLLAKLFLLGKGTITPPPAGKFDVALAGSHFDGERWTVEARIRRRSGNSPWRVEGVLKLEAETGAGSPLSITEVATDVGSPAWPNGGSGAFSIDAPGDIDEVVVTVRGAVPEEADAVSARTRMRADLRAHEVA